MRANCILPGNEPPLQLGSMGLYWGFLSEDPRIMLSPPGPGQTNGFFEKSFVIYSYHDVISSNLCTHIPRDFEELLGQLYVVGFSVLTRSVPIG